MTGHETSEKPLGIQGLLGVGFDGKDGETRISQGPNFYLVDGSTETHERMQETALKFNEKIDGLGKPLPEVNRRELRDIVHEMGDDD